jgi:hypothetical protein
MPRRRHGDSRLLLQEDLEARLCASRSADRKLFEAGTTTDVVTDSWAGLTFTTGFTSTPGLLAALGTYDGADNAHLRYTNLTASGAQVKVEEDTTFATELTHSTEIVVYLVIEGQGILTATQILP